MNLHFLFVLVAGLTSQPTLVHYASTSPIPPAISDCEGFSIKDLTDQGYRPSLGGLASALDSKNAVSQSVALGIVHQRKIEVLLPNVQQAISKLLSSENKVCNAEYAIHVCFSIKGEDFCNEFSSVLDYERRRSANSYEAFSESSIAYMYVDFAKICKLKVRDEVLARALSPTWDVSAARCYIIEILLTCYKETIDDNTLASLYAHWAWYDDLAQAIRVASGRPLDFFKDIRPSRQRKS